MEVPKSLKGEGGFRHFISSAVIPFDWGDNGTASLTLDTAKTKKANNAGITVAEAVAALK